MLKCDKSVIFIVCWNFSVDTKLKQNLHSPCCDLTSSDWDREMDRRRNGRRGII